MQSTATPFPVPEEQLGAPLTEARPYIEARGLSRCFGAVEALKDVSLSVAPGEIHAILGRNGAGKTTLLRILSGLTTPHEGSVTVLGEDVLRRTQSLRGRVGLVPSGDRSFYLRLSGFENLLFFARLYGIRKRVARERAMEALRSVGLENTARRRVGHYSHGMQKRLSVARALLIDPPLLLVDEATHDLDPHAAGVVRELVRGVAAHGTAAVWATQRVEEIRGFAHRVTVLREGEVIFAGSVAALTDEVAVRTHVLVIGGNGRPSSRLAIQRALGSSGTVVEADHRAGEFVLQLADGVILGDALARLTGAGVELVSCREERPEIEEAFIRLTGRP